MVGMDRAGLQWRKEDKYPTISHIYWGLLGPPWMVLDRQVAVLAVWREPVSAQIPY